MKNKIIFPCAALSLAAALSWPVAAWAQAKYASPEAAADALINAVSTNNTKALAIVLGQDWRKLLPPDGVDPADRQAFLDKAKERRAVTLADAHGELVVGNDPWAFPVPLLRGSDSQWHFDPKGGRDAIRERRIGANERAAMQAVLAYLDAQREYATADRNADGVFEYARRFYSNKGKRDGLIWDPTLGDDSPLGEAYVPSKPDSGYHGYRFKILEGQGPHATGGARSYLIGNRLMSGFALIAWPVTYGETGVTSFIVNQEGVVYERNLGPDSSAIAKGITQFDPVEPWHKVAP
ncbi:MAG TPA: DUF2950 domain-containing protein [Rhizobacter sp.]|nr:DUF2950 domain-containing protein [Rhizobacter sp.]